MADGTRPQVPMWLQVGAAYAWRLLLVAAALVVAGLAFTRLRVVTVPLVAALFLSTLLAPPAQWLRRHRVPRLLAAWIVFLMAAGVVAGVVIGVLPTARAEFPLLGRDLAAGLGRAEGWLVNGPLGLSHRQISLDVAHIENFFKADQSRLVRGALSGVAVILEVLAGLLLTLVMTFFFVKDADTITSWVLRSTRDERRALQLTRLGRDVWAALTGYVRGTAVNGAVNAFVLSLTLGILGVPLILPVAILTFIGGFIPLLGAIISGLLAALVTLVVKGPVAALVVVGATILIHNLEGYLVGPLVLGKAVRLHPVAVLLALGVGSVLGGIVGAFVAVPVLAIAIAVVASLRESMTELALPDSGELRALTRSPTAAGPSAGAVRIAPPGSPPRAAGDD